MERLSSGAQLRTASAWPNPELLLLGFRLLAGLARGRVQHQAVVEGRRFGGGVHPLRTAAHDVERLLARLALVERGVEPRQKQTRRVREVRERQRLARERPDDRQAR